MVGKLKRFDKRQEQIVIMEKRLSHLSKEHQKQTRKDFGAASGDTLTVKAIAAMINACTTFASE